MNSVRFANSGGSWPVTKCSRDLLQGMGGGKNQTGGQTISHGAGCPVEAQHGAHALAGALQQRNTAFRNGPEAPPPPWRVPTPAISPWPHFPQLPIVLARRRLLPIRPPLPACRSSPPPLSDTDTNAASDASPGFLPPLFCHPAPALLLTAWLPARVGGGGGGGRGGADSQVLQGWDFCKYSCVAQFDVEKALGAPRVFTRSLELSARTNAAKVS